MGGIILKKIFNCDLSSIPKKYSLMFRRIFIEKWLILHGAKKIKITWTLKISKIKYLILICTGLFRHAWSNIHVLFSYSPSAFSILISFSRSWTSMWYLELDRLLFKVTRSPHVFLIPYKTLDLLRYFSSFDIIFLYFLQL